MFLVLALIVTGFNAMSSKFLSHDNVVNILRTSAPILLVCSGVTLIMIAAQIDLSVGSMVALSGVVYCILLKNGFGFFEAALLVFVLGGIMGWVNGLLVTKLRIVPVIATLVTLYVFRGIARALTPKGSGLIKGNMPEGINDFARADVFLGLPAAFYVAIAVILIMVIVQKMTVLGKYAAAIGGNRTAAELSGINVIRTIWILYIIVGVLSSVGGIASASYISMGDSKIGKLMELDVIIAVLLGGTRFNGGEGSVLKTIVGALIIMCVSTGMRVSGIHESWQPFAKGVVLIGTIAVYTLITKKVEKEYKAG